MRRISSQTSANYYECGHTPDVSQNVYRQSPVASRLPAVNKLEKKLLVM